MRRLAALRRRDETSEHERATARSGVGLAVLGGALLLSACGHASVSPPPSSAGASVSGSNGAHRSHDPSKIAPGATEMTAVLTPEMHPGEPGRARAVSHDGAVIATIIRRIDTATPLPNTPLSCPMDTGGVLTLSFRRSPGAAPYATVTASETGCQLLRVIQDGRAEPQSQGYGFVYFVEKALSMYPRPVGARTGF